MKKSLFLLFGISFLLSACGIKDEVIADTIVDVTNCIQTEITKEANHFADDIFGNSSKETSQETTQETSQETSLQEVTVIRVVDGDTIVVAINGTEEKVRMIGIDTPESVHSDSSKNTEYGIMASDYTKSIITETVYLEYDEDKTDQYDRLLCYVWLCNDTSNIENMLNARLLKDGYAFNKEYKPNIKYAEDFEEICNAAEINNSGLWEYEAFYKY